MSELVKKNIYKCPICGNESTDSKDGKDNICPECWIKDHIKIKTFFLREIYMKELRIKHD